MNNIIKPHYVDFNTAKLLKEKRLVADCKKYWVKYTDTEYKEMSDIQLEDLDREIGIGGNLVIPKYEQWQVVEWLRINHGIWVEVNYGIYHAVKGTFSDTDLYGFYFTIKSIDEKDVYIFGDEEDIVNWFDSPQEAYSEAFDYVLNNLI